MVNDNDINNQNEQELDNLDDEKINNEVLKDQHEGDISAQDQILKDRGFDVDDLEIIKNDQIFHSRKSTKKIKDKGSYNIDNIDLDIKVIIGSASISMNKILSIEEGSIIELDRRVGEDVDIYINDNIIAKGEIVVIDESIGVSITEILR